MPSLPLQFAVACFLLFTAPAPACAQAAPSSQAPPFPHDSLLLYFESNHSLLTRQSDSVIDSYFAGLREPVHGISLQGYCDSTGTDAYNDRLSQARVFAVRNYLIRHWADVSDDLHLSWFGKRSPLNDNATSQDRAANRRVLILIPKAIPTLGLAFAPATRSAARRLTELVADSTTRVGTTIVLRDVVFIGGRHQPQTFSFVALEELRKAMEDHPGLRINIEGHVCCLPDSLDGMDFDTGKTDLSVERAKYVFDYLLKSGIDPDRMSYAGFGAAKKLFPDESDAAQQARNRRVEIRILAK